ncbi:MULTISPECIES: bifunctional ADP-dependent NAD(P)H-hydrate dehydratase/NAD(P)H-hydrate epimerase [unclassified Lebetimonas]|uniref:bifunctional ADP-dependent NAD(P)H-hydrate dehydratase/NAD(P)H-hydrate epimerase n=1 Tax=unclassified Lebetimonas TaxID=2648158 RepID=UPI000463C368|nr:MULTISPECIES: bifunctional ADP-dependent NAD(P)H-hydrate dehydratase/NAD(P)H-hydrate epimerase [unclassified Lebetimonas]
MREVFENVYFLDKKCYEKYNLREDILMEHAAYEMALEIYKRFEKGSSVTIISGPGNNGADGITLARILLGDYKVNLFLPLNAKSAMAKLQLERFLRIGGKVSKKIKKADVLVDAIFGSGLKRDLDDGIADVVENMNEMDSFKIACDIPTGIDDKGNLRPVSFRADVTVTMGAEKLALYSDMAKDYVGEIKIANLGVSFSNYIEKSSFFVLEKNDLKLPFRNKQNTHKRSYGHLGILCGEKKGASIMAGMAAFNFGCGLVSLVTHKEVNAPYEIMQTHHIENFSALAFGMGLGNYFDDELEEIAKLDIPMIIDADMFYKKEILKFLKKDVVLTPHPKEFSSLLKLTGIGEYSVKEIQKNRFDLALEFSKKYPGVVLLLKGANKIIVHNKKLFIDPLGNVALAKGGSGDVLAGMIGSLLAQGESLLDATINASLAHSVAGNYEPNYALTPIKLIKRLEEINI